MQWTLSPRRVLIKGLVIAKNPRTILFRKTLQQTVLYLWSISEVSVEYSSKEKYRPNEVPLRYFNFKIKHENIEKINLNHSAEILKEFFLSFEPTKTIP